MNGQEVLEGRTHAYNTGCGKIYVTLNRDQEGRLAQCFIKLGKSGVCAACHSSAIAKLLARSLQAGVPPQKLAEDLRGVACDRPIGFGEDKIVSCVDAVGKAITADIAMNNTEMRDGPEEEKEHITQEGVA